MHHMGETFVVDCNAMRGSEQSFNSLDLMLIF